MCPARTMPRLNLSWCIAHLFCKLVYICTPRKKQAGKQTDRLKGRQAGRQARVWQGSRQTGKSLAENLEHTCISAHTCKDCYVSLPPLLYGPVLGWVGPSVANSGFAMQKIKSRYFAQIIQANLGVQQNAALFSLSLLTPSPPPLDTFFHDFFSQPLWW